MRLGVFSIAVKGLLDVQILQLPFGNTPPLHKKGVLDDQGRPKRFFENQNSPHRGARSGPQPVAGTVVHFCAAFETILTACQLQHTVCSDSSGRHYSLV